MPAGPDAARLAALFDEAVELGEREHADFLATRCANDPELRDALARLLRHDRAAAEFLRAGPIAYPEDPVPEDMSPGTRIGHLTILSEIGRGSAGIVYAARDETLGREVAVKRITSAIWGSPHRVIAEARALARLSHPNVVQVHELHEHHGEILLVMERVHGVSLGAWSQARPRPWRELLDAFVQAGRGLAAAHALALVHGDFKPDNVLVGDDGRVRVVDFGLARLHVDPDHDQLAGTMLYMAPEQFAGHPGDARSDQFSYCVALYICLFGQSPFPADNLFVLLARLEHPPAPPPANDLPPALVTAILRGLAPAPGARWPDMDALLAALDRELARDPEDDLRVSRRQRRAATVGLLLVAVAIDLYIFFGPGAARELTPLDLVRFMLAVWLGLLALVLVYGRALRRNRANRRLVGVILLVFAGTLVHRVLGLVLATPVAHTLVGDLLLMATGAGVSALTFRAQFAGLAAIFLLAAVFAALAPERAPAVFSATSVSSFALVMLWWARDGEV